MYMPALHQSKRCIKIALALGAQQGLDNPEQLKEFTALGFTFSTQHSTDTKFVFVK